jgi:hypothetical protein
MFHIHGLVGAVLATMASGGSLVCTPGMRTPLFFDLSRGIIAKLVYYQQSSAARSPEAGIGRRRDRHLNCDPRGERRCRRYLCWNLFSAVSGASRQSRRVTGYSPSLGSPSANGGVRAQPTPSNGFAKNSNAASRPRQCCHQPRPLFWALLAAGQITIVKLTDGRH